MRDFIKKLRKFVLKLPDRVLDVGLTILGLLTLFAIFDVETLKKIELFNISNIANTVDNFFLPFCNIFKNNAIKIIIYTLFVALIFLRVFKFAMRAKAIVVKHSTFSNALSTYDESNLSGYSVKEIDINLVNQMNNLDIINAINIQDGIIRGILKDCDEFTEILNEELAEYQESKSLEELADLLEVMQAVVKARGWTLEELEQVRADKTAKRGGFEKKILLKEVREE